MANHPGGEVLEEKFILILNLCFLICFFVYRLEVKDVIFVLLQFDAAILAKTAHPYCQDYELQLRGLFQLVLLEKLEV